jgi:uncharacterized membrane protein YfcA
MGPRWGALVRNLGLAVCLCLVPRIASAHGGSVLILFFWEAVAIPWAIFSYLVARSKLTDQNARNRLGPVTLIATLIGVLGGWCGVWSLSQVLADPSPLSPLILVVAGAPGVWYLWRQRTYDWALALLLIPLALTGTCGALAFGP